MNDSQKEMTLKERVEAFQCMELPGQPRIMHMGTAYLVNDLWREVQRLERVLGGLSEDIIVKLKKETK